MMLRVEAVLTGEQLEGCTYRHPLYDRTSPVVIGGDYITTETGVRGLIGVAALLEDVKRRLGVAGQVSPQNVREGLW